MVNLITSVACISHDNLQSGDPTGAVTGFPFDALVAITGGIF